MLEKIEGYKTVVFFGLTLLITLANVFGFADFQVSEEQHEIILVVVSIAGLVLRYLTKSEIFQKEE
jgi:hypothetical protein